MASSISWLDTTAEEQRIARELIALFTETESRDELGIGQVRDAFSEMLFPGTSVIQTRARYFLLVPWSYRDGSARGTSGDVCRTRGEKQERQLIKTLLDAHRDGKIEDVSGLVGIRRGPTVKTLPSSIYWNALQRYDILNPETDRGHLGLHGESELDVATELAERQFGDWHPALPPAPKDFPQELPTGFDLTHEEAAWLAERIQATTSGTALSHLLDHQQLVAPSQFPWEAIPEDQFEELHHARLFSTVMHGSALLYNLLIAERYSAHPQLSRLDDTTVDIYRDRLTAWSDLVISPMAGEVRGWDVDGMWAQVSLVNRRIHPATRLFVDAWINAVKQGQAHRAADAQDLRQLVSQRESRKGKQSRLANDRLLASWSGASGAGQLAFRWGTVRVLVNDVVRGLHAAS